MIVDVFAFDGELVEVMQIEGGRISVRDGRERWRTLSLTAFLSRGDRGGRAHSGAGVGHRNGGPVDRPA
jgi:hypothetical protein